MGKIYVKFKVEGWIETYEEAFNRDGISLESMAYEMSQGNGICTLMKEIERTTGVERMDDTAISFFMPDGWDEQ